METPIRKIWHVRKIEEDHYHIHCDEELDEKVNSLQFTGMLNGSSLAKFESRALSSSSTHRTWVITHH
jgi:hypothetical protein